MVLPQIIDFSILTMTYLSISTYVGELAAACVHSKTQVPAVNSPPDELVDFKFQYSFTQQYKSRLFAPEREEDGLEFLKNLRKGVLLNVQKSIQHFQDKTKLISTKTLHNIYN